MFDKFVHKYLKFPYRLNVALETGQKHAAKTVIFLHGIGNSGQAWKSVVDKIDDQDVRLIALDLLGFGESPAPDWGVYDVHEHAKSVERTLFYLDVKPPYILVGHSLGALIAIEIAKTQSDKVSQLILCSPPFYKSANGSKKLIIDEAYRRLYRRISQKPDSIRGLSKLNQKLVNKYFDQNSVGTGAFRSTLEASIVNQTSLDDAIALQIPTEIIYGRLDPIVIKANLTQLVRTNPHTKLRETLGGHDVLGPMIPATVEAVRRAIHDKMV